MAEGVDPSTPSPSHEATSQSATSWEYEVLCKNSAGIITPLAKSRLSSILSNHLRARGIIGQDVFDQATSRGPDVTEYARVKHLIDALLSKINLNSQYYHHFIEILQSDCIHQDARAALALLPTGLFSAYHPIPAEFKMVFLGNGEWTFPLQLEEVGSGEQPLSLQEKMYKYPKEAYPMRSRIHGCGLIINNKNFTCGLKDRVGTDRDADVLTKLFIYLGFYTNRYDNLKGTEMHSRFQSVSKLDHSRFDCLMVAILTHGINGKLYSTDGDLIPVEDITRYFDGENCPSLIGKPKIFILEADRGGKFDYGVETKSTDSKSDMKELMEKQHHPVDLTLDDPDAGEYLAALPNEADFLLAYATVPGYVSWRNSVYGSWFIKAFCDIMFELASHEHLMDILTEVNRRLAEKFQTNGRNKQIPEPVTRLTRKLYFRPGQFSEQEKMYNYPKVAYPMFSRPRGIGLIINNKNFTCGMKERVGTDRDAEALMKLFIYLGFYINRYDNLKGTEMHSRSQSVSELDHSRFDCLMVAILTHGVSSKLYSTDGDLIPVEDITRYFDGNNCPSLIGKPKIFILQIDRGGKFDYGVEICTEAILPNEADFLLAHPTIPGYVSLRISEYGSWFIKAFCDTMFELASREHLMDILTEVNRRVAEEFKSRGHNKQIPEPATRLIRKLYFRPVTTATYADPSTIKRREFPGTHDLYTMVDETKKTHKPEDHMHLPTDKVPAVLEIAFSELEVGDKLGSGGYGTVYKGWWKTRGVDVAIKRVVGKIREEEAEILGKLSHPNVINLYGVTNQYPEYFIITEFASGGSLHDCIHGKKYHPEEIKSLQWAKEIAEGMRYLHKKRILHRDLKSQNVLLTSHYGNVKLCDFGSAIEFEQTATQSAAGTYRWIAPEVVKGEKVSLSSDVFSYGMVLFEIFKQEIPFASVQSLQVPTMIMEGVTPAIPDSLNPYLVNLMKCCWQMNPKARPSFLEILDILEKKECPQPVSELSEVPQPETTVIARPTTTATLLTPNDLPQLQASLEEASILWHPLGIKLKLDTKSLSGIATASGNDFSTALGFVLMRWLKPKDSVPVTMETLIDALSSPEIGMSPLAESLSKDKDKFGNVN